jgi:hypothetical protein
MSKKGNDPATYRVATYVKITVREDDLDKMLSLLEVIEDAPYIDHERVIKSLKDTLYPIGRVSTATRKLY